MVTGANNNSNPPTDPVTGTGDTGAITTLVITDNYKRNMYITIGVVLILITLTIIYLTTRKK